MSFGAESAAQAGWTITRRPYPSGAAGIRQSLEEVARLMREARLDPDVKQWAVQTLKAKGLDGRNRPSIRQQTQCLLDAFRAQTIYVPDAAGAEHIQAAHVTLCLRDRCIPGEDCESLVIALGGAMLAIGLPAYGVKVTYGAGHQEHILLGLIDDNDKKIYADPSTKSAVMDRVPLAVDEMWVDPLDQVGAVGTGAEIVTLGRPLLEEGLGARQLFYQDGRWIEFAYGQWWTYLKNGQWVRNRSRVSGYGQPFAREGKWFAQHGNVEVELTDTQADSMGLGAPTTTGSANSNTGTTTSNTGASADSTLTSDQVTGQVAYQQVTNNQVQLGFRYRVGMQLVFQEDPSTIGFANLADLFSADWFIESIDAQAPANQLTGTTTTWEQSYILQGIAKNSFTLTDGTLSGAASNANSLVGVTVSYLVVAVQASSANPTGAVAGTAVPAGSPSSFNLSAPVVILLGSVVGGGWWAWHQRKHGRKLFP